MSFDELRRQLAVALRSDLVLARRLTRRYQRLAETKGSALDRADALFQAAQLEHVAGRLVGAARRYADVRRRFARLGESDRAFAADVSAIQVHGLLGDRRAVALHARRLRSADVGAIATAYAEIAIGSANQALGDESASEASFRRALAALGRRRKPERVGLARATARLNLGISLARRGAVHEAIRETRAALDYFVDRDLSVNAEIALHNLGWARSLAGDLAAASRDLGHGREAFLRRGDRRRAALVDLDEAEMVLRLGDAPTAARQARRAARALKREDLALEAGRAGLVAARALSKLGRRAAARREAGAARDLFRERGDRTGVAMANTLLGEDLARAEGTLRSGGHFVAGLEALVARARALPPGEGARLIRERGRGYPAPVRRWVAEEMLRLQAEAEPERAIPLLRRAVRAGEELRRRAPTGRLRSTTLATHLRSYEALAAALLARDRPADRKEAFLVLDAARARTLSEEMERGAPELAHAPAVARLRRDLEARWAALARLEQEGGDLRRAQRRLLAHVGRIEKELVEAIEKSAAGPQSRRREPAGPCLALAPLGRELVALLYRAGRVESWSCGPLGTLLRRLRRFRFEVRRQLHAGVPPGAAEAQLEAMGSAILARAPELPEHRLTVVLPGVIGDLPFEALPRDGAALAERLEIAYAPTARPARRRGSRRAGTVLVGADDATLPALADELKVVRRTVGGGSVVTGDKATREAILAALDGCGLVHVAGHVDSRPDRPMLSALRLRDGWLAATDLAGARLDGALVVLSTCRGGDPSLEWRGETLAGFPRVLLAAGATAVIASRWEVRDEVAREWMRRFYRELARAPAERACARALRLIRRLFPHPADWAGFLVINRGTVPTWDGSV